MEFSLGLVEVSALGNAIMMLDEMLKVADVEFISVERKLGGALVTVVVRGSVSAVTASVEAGRRFAESAGVLKAAEVIARPHSEILKFLNLPENEKKEEPPKAPKEVKAPDVKPAEKPAKKAEAKPKATKAPAKKAEVEQKTVKAPAKKAEEKPKATKVPVKKAEAKPKKKPTTKTATKATKIAKSKAVKASDIKKSPKGKN